MSALQVTAVSTGSDPAGWRQWWEVERIRTGTTWRALLNQHCDVFRQLCLTRGPSS
jgi:hypothetical protein